MQKTNRPVFTELIWLAVSFIITALVIRFIFGWTPSKSTFNVHIHDTYFVFPPATVIGFLGCLITFCIFFLKELRNRFSQTLPNSIIFVSGLLLTALLTKISQAFIISEVSFTGGWIAYSPLSLPDVHTGPHRLTPMGTIAANVQLVLSIMIILALMLVSFRMGQKKQGS